ncbi:MAG: ribonuclease D [Nanoarchaeota archaeon]
MVHFQYLTQPRELLSVVKSLEHSSLIAVDVECENNLHHFGAKLSLIQVSTNLGTWIIDVLAIKDLSSLRAIFESETIQKVFHDVSFDLRILFHQFGWNMRNIYDTQLAAKFLGKEKIGLGSLLEEYFDVRKEEKFQRFDWLRRPLPSLVLDYAAKDTMYLSDLKRKLEEELQQNGKKSWVDEECRHLQDMDWSYHEQTYLDISGVRSLSAQERGRVRSLFALRQDLAKQVDKPAFMIFTNKQLIQFAQSPPDSWHNLRVHLLVKRNSILFEQAIQNAQPVELKREREFTPQQMQAIRHFLEARNIIAQKIALAPSLLISTEEIQEVVRSNSLSSLRNWQKALLERPLKMVLEKK